jgi:hypothetical protein
MILARRRAPTDARSKPIPVDAGLLHTEVQSVKLVNARSRGQDVMPWLFPRFRGTALSGDKHVVANDMTKCDGIHEMPCPCLQIDIISLQWSH